MAYGDRVVILLENSLEYVTSYYGILKVGAVAVPLSTDTKPDGLAHYLRELEPKVMISAAIQRGTKVWESPYFEKKCPTNISLLR